MKIPSNCSSDTMEESSPSQNHNGQLGPSSAGLNVGNKQADDGSQRPPYSIPGILHFIQHEWARFEMERSQWDVDRAELQARIAFLQGERKGQENLKNDLVRRIKMLEYALKQERAKYHKLKFGTDLQQGDMKPPKFEEPGPDEPTDGDTPFTSVSNVSWRQGRALLRQYLQEIGYTDTIIDVRSNRVRSLLGLNNNAESEENLNNSGGLSSVINGNESSNKRASENQGRRTPAKKSQPALLTESMILDTEAAVMANFEFLQQADVDMDDDDDMIDELDEQQELDEDDVKSLKRKPKGMCHSEGLAEDIDTDAEAEEVLHELNLLTETEDASDIRSQGDTTDWAGVSAGMGFQSGAGHRRPMGGGLGDEEVLDSTLGLGELAQLTVNNEAEAAYDIATTKDSYRKTWNAKYTLRSHFDGVRALAFHPVEPVLITASEDHTLKLWNLQKTVPAKKSASLDVEPLYTFRCHTGPVLCLSMGATGESCYSGGLDGAVHCWTLPNANIDPYDSYDPSVVACTLAGHTDAVWALSLHSQRSQLVSCSSDGTVKLWSPATSTCALSSYSSEADGWPTSVDFVRDEPNRIVAAYNTGVAIIYDIETTKPVVRLEVEDSEKSAMQMNSIVAHPTLPLTMAAHEDRHIRFFDNNSGKMVHSMVAHLDSVTSLAIDPNGLYLLSGSHDCSIRLWNLDNKTCVQEITAHRKKFDESIFAVAFHPSRPYIASAGADGLAKVFV